MKKVHTEIYVGKTIDVYVEYNSKYYRHDYSFKVNDENPTFKDKGMNRYRSIGIAMGAAKKYIGHNMSKADEMKKLEDEIAALQTKLEKLRG